MKKVILSLIAIIATLGCTAQDLTFKVKDMKDTTVFLAKYLGPKLYYAATVESKKGVIVFDGKKHEKGLYAVVIPGSRYFEFVHDNEIVEMQVNDQNDLIGSMKVVKSKNNKVFYDYIMFMTEKKRKSGTLSQQYTEAKNDKIKQDSILNIIRSIGKEITVGQRELYEAHKDKFIGTMIRLSMDAELPEPPKDANGVITDSSYVYNYYIKHYWDDIPLKDAAIVRTPIFHNKLDKFFSKNGLIQIPDTITKHAKILIDQMDFADQNNKVFQYTVHHITQKYEASKIMGMDRVFVFMADNYYCGENNKAYWMSEENSKKICDRADDIRKTMIGEYAPMLILTDTTEENWINSYKIDADYTVLYFWDPNCGHCKKTTPKLQHLYDEKFKKRNIEIYSIGKATGEDFEAWKKYIHENELTFINVGLTKNIYEIAMDNPRDLLKHTTLQSLNYTDTYDIYSTPRIFILDENKKILFKQLSIGQLEEILDNLTGNGDDIKLYPKEDPENGHEQVEDDHEGHNH